MNTKLELRVSDVQVLNHKVCAAVSRLNDVICLITSRNQQPCNVSLIFIYIFSLCGLKLQ
jgi:hypothetical protein